jgi:hypothetical protein
MSRLSDCLSNLKQSLISYLVLSKEALREVFVCNNQISNNLCRLQPESLILEPQLSAIATLIQELLFKFCPRHLIDW